MLTANIPKVHEFLHKCNAVKVWSFSIILKMHGMLQCKRTPWFFPAVKEGLVFPHPCLRFQNRVIQISW